ncbi:MAG: acyl carrier protein [Chromatiales bacterium]|nr:acyl carrier protein [Chromatiales bacterium]
MNDTEIRALLADVLAGIAPEADLATVGDDEDLRAALDLDSMDFMNLVIGLHQRTGIDIPEADVPKLFTLRGLTGYLAR